MPRVSSSLVAVLVGLLVSAATVAQMRPDPPPPKNPILTNPPRGPSAWERIQDPVDRSTGRITNEPTYQLERMQRERDEAYRRTIPQTEVQRFEEERERRLRIEARERVQIADDQARKRELDRREYELRLSGGYMAGGHAAADERALMQAKGRRDEQLIAAQNERAESLRQKPGDRARIDEEYQRRTTTIREEYDRERGRILGVESVPPPTTQPQP